MPVKSLVRCCQDSLTKSLDVLAEVGCVPYSLLKNSLRCATPQQLYRIERANPGLAAETDELWLNHCLIFKEIRDDYERGLHRDPKEWRELYLNQYKEMERKRKEIKERVASQYSKIKNEKAARSIKVLHGIVPTTRNHSYESARQSTMSKLFQQTKRAASKATSIYQQPKKSTAVPSIAQNFTYAPSASNLIRAPKPPSKLMKAYQYNRIKFPIQKAPIADLIAPRSNVPPKINVEKVVKKQKLNDERKIERKTEKIERKVERKGMKNDPTKTDIQKEPKKKPAALVNFNIFNELS
ncbi:RNA polymerase II transcription factor SIII subunit A-domain-containing protein [Pilaira anomala]|nr:RNA polymerase II transcription factor SIII subunit A-domain-containing protein [Pilaira anomala]